MGSSKIFSLLINTDRASRPKRSFSMEKNRHITLYHWPHSRSVATHYLLEELTADYELKIVDIRKDEQKKPDFLALNSMGKIPTIRHGDAVVTESTAILLYLSDLYADRGLTPGINDPLRGPYLRWVTFYGACFEPAVADRALKREAAKAGVLPYGDFETMWSSLTAQLAGGDYMLGAKFHTLDVLWASGLSFMTRFGVLPKHDGVAAYIERVESRASFAAVNAQSELILQKAGN